MQKNHLEQQRLFYYGKKVYYFNPLIAQKENIVKNEPEYFYDNFQDTEIRKT